jgi:hypothetical protein
MSMHAVHVLSESYKAIRSAGMSNPISDFLARTGPAIDVDDLFVHRGDPEPFANITIPDLPRARPAIIERLQDLATTSDLSSAGLEGVDMEDARVRVCSKEELSDNHMWMKLGADIQKLKDNIRKLKRVSREQPLSGLCHSR